MPVAACVMGDTARILFGTLHPSASLVLSLLCLQLVLDVRRLMRVLQNEAADGSVDVVELASRLSAMGYRVTVGAKPAHAWFQSCCPVCCPQTACMSDILCCTAAPVCFGTSCIPSP